VSDVHPLCEHRVLIPNQVTHNLIWDLTGLKEIIPLTIWNDELFDEEIIELSMNDCEEKCIETFLRFLTQGYYFTYIKINLFKKNVLK